MITITTNIPKLEFDDFGSDRSKPHCGLEFAPTTVFANYKPREPFRVTLWNDGFEAWRALSRDDLASIIDWATMALRETSQ